MRKMKNNLTDYQYKIFYRKRANKVFPSYIRSLNFGKSHLRLRTPHHVWCLQKLLYVVPFKKNKNRYHNPQKTLAFNFKRNRFFPTLRTIKGESYVFLSLGMLAKFFQKNKSFLKTKTMYLLLVSFLRKILLFSSFKALILTISRVPVFLKEILNTLNDPVTNLYKNPFNDKLVSEKTIINPFKFSLIMFINNKPFGKIKLRKKGRLKRKISKRITLLNRLVD